MKIAICLLFLLTAPLVSLAADPEPTDKNRWTHLNTGFELTYLALHVIDWGQTRNIAKHPWDLSEKNPILGKHPSLGSVNTYFALTGLGHAAISYLLPKPYREWWQCITIGVEGGTVGRNFRTGVRMDW